eukprot:jgi/Chlat1/3621/Chrsp237S03625
MADDATDGDQHRAPLEWTKKELSNGLNLVFMLTQVRRYKGHGRQPTYALRKELQPILPQFYPLEAKARRSMKKSPAELPSTSRGTRSAQPKAKGKAPQVPLDNATATEFTGLRDSDLARRKRELAAGLQAIDDELRRRLKEGRKQTRCADAAFSSTQPKGTTQGGTTTPRKRSRTSYASDNDADVADEAANESLTHDERESTFCDGAISLFMVVPMSIPQRHKIEPENKLCLRCKQETLGIQDKACTVCNQPLLCLHCAEGEVYRERLQSLKMSDQQWTRLVEARNAPIKYHSHSSLESALVFDTTRDEGLHRCLEGSGSAIAKAPCQAGKTAVFGDIVLTCRISERPCIIIVMDQKAGLRNLCKALVSIVQSREDSSQVGVEELSGEADAWSKFIRSGRWKDWLSGKQVMVMLGIEPALTQLLDFLASTAKARNIVLVIDEADSAWTNSDRSKWNQRETALYQLLADTRVTNLVQITATTSTVQAWHIHHMRPFRAFAACDKRLANNSIATAEDILNPGEVFFEDSDVCSDNLNGVSSEKVLRDCGGVYAWVAVGYDGKIRSITGNTLQLAMNKLPECALPVRI